MDRAPYLLTEGRWGYRMGHSPDLRRHALRRPQRRLLGEHSGWHTEDLVTKHQITREDQDRWALRSQQRFSCGPGRRQVRRRDRAGRGQDAQGAGSRSPRTSTTGRTPPPRASPSSSPPSARTGRSPPAMRRGSTARPRRWSWPSAAGRSGTGVQPMARLVSWGVAAVEPGMFGIGPVPAVQQALERAGWTIGDVERIEINEAFAAIALAVHARARAARRRSSTSRAAAIAHGHAIGATGAVLTTRLLHSMRRDGLKRGVVTMCIGGGQGIALCLEALAERSWQAAARPARRHRASCSSPARVGSARPRSPVPSRSPWPTPAGGCCWSAPTRPPTSTRCSAVELADTPRAVPGVPGLAGHEHRPGDGGRGLSRARAGADARPAASEAELATVREQLSGACTTEIAAFDEFAGLLAGDEPRLRPCRLRHRADRPHAAALEPAQGLERLSRGQRPGRVLPRAAFRPEDAARTASRRRSTPCPIRRRPGSSW